MPRLRPFALVAPVVAASLFGFVRAAEAQEVAQAAPTPQYVPVPQAPAAQPQAPTVVIQQYQPPVYQAPTYPQAPVYPAPYPQAQPSPYYLPQAVPAQAVPAPGPRVIPNWDDSQPVPPGYHTVTHIRKDLVIAGASLFGSFYLISALVAAGNGDANQGSSNPAAALWVPGVGPFIQMTQTGSEVAGVFLAIDGIIQMGGLTMFTIGLASPKTELVRNDIGLHLHIAPIVARDRSGMALVGTF